MTPSQLIEFRDKLEAAGRKIMVAKNHDYCGGDDATTDPFKNFRMVEQLGICSVETGLLVRMCDKFSRLIHLVQGVEAKVKDESRRDTALDFVNYLILLEAFIEAGGDPEMAIDIMAADKRRADERRANFPPISQDEPIGEVGE